MNKIVFCIIFQKLANYSHITTFIIYIKVSDIFLVFANYGLFFK